MPSAYKKLVTILVVVFVFGLGTLGTEAKRNRDKDREEEDSEEQLLLQRPQNYQQQYRRPPHYRFRPNGGRNPERGELFSGIQDPEGSAQGLQGTAISPFGIGGIGGNPLLTGGGGLNGLNGLGGLGLNGGGLNGLNGLNNAALYSALAGGGGGGLGGFNGGGLGGINGFNGLGGGGGGFNPYLQNQFGGLGGLGGGGGLGNYGLGLGQTGLGNQYLFGQQQGLNPYNDYYAQQAQLGGGVFSNNNGNGFRTNGGLTGLGATNSAGAGFGGLGSATVLGNNAFHNRGNPYNLSQVLLNPYLNPAVSINPSIGHPYNPRFGTGNLRGSPANRNNSNNDE